MTRLISSLEIAEDIDKLMDAWGPNWIADPHKKLALDDLWEAQRHIEAIESAARKAALQKPVRSTLEMVDDICRPPDFLRGRGAL